MKKQLEFLINDLSSRTSFSLVPTKRLINVLLSLAPNLRSSIGSIIVQFKKLPFSIWQISFGTYFSLVVPETELLAVLKNALNVSK